MPIVELQRTLRRSNGRSSQQPLSRPSWVHWSVCMPADASSGRCVNLPAPQRRSPAGGSTRDWMRTGTPTFPRLGQSFNEMAEALQARIEQDERFVSDVTHELRTPLTAISAAIDVLDRRADNGARPAVDVLRSQIRHFERLVLDLLEISRLDAGATELITEPVDPRELVSTVLRRLAHADITVTSEPSVPRSHSPRQAPGRTCDHQPRRQRRPARRWARARPARHGERARAPDSCRGRGPGNSSGRTIGDLLSFSSWPSGRRRGDERGNGLGLVLVAEHCRVHGGRAWVEDRRRWRRPVRCGAVRTMKRHASRGVLAILAAMVASLTACGIPAQHNAKVIPDSALPSVLAGPWRGALVHDLHDVHDTRLAALKADATAATVGRFPDYSHLRLPSRIATRPLSRGLLAARMQRGCGFTLIRAAASLCPAYRPLATTTLPADRIVRRDQRRSLTSTRYGPSCAKSGPRACRRAGRRR